MNKGRKKALGGIVFGVGLIAILIGAMTDLYTTNIGVIIMLGVWIIGGALVALMSGGKEEPPKPPEQE